MRVLVSGANGFVGKALCAALTPHHQVYGTTRHAGTKLPTGVLPVVWDGTAAGLSALPEVDAVIHLAARVHVMDDDSADPLAAFRSANVDMTRDLALWAASRGVKRFVFMSTIKVNGEATAPGKAFHADDVPAPEDAYGLSKLEAEQALRSVCENSGMAFVVIRPPLVYGPGVRGNFASMLRWVKRGIPLPLGAISNRRSLVGLDNLVSFTQRCLEHPDAANQVFLVSDGEAVSTIALLRGIAEAYGIQPRLISVPPSGLRWVVGLLGKSKIADRLLGSLVVDGAKGCELLAWQPVSTMKEQLRKIAQDDALL
ncbi:MAG: SDR family oxidoreductase [Rhodocyclaceae bacterium]|nr:SDR family oxidoreductase [Rhodocyclaceae bacterium]